MEYTLEDVFNKVAERIDIVYLIDTSSDTYITIKDNKLFHGLFGSSGLYSKMMSVFFESTVDRLVSESSPYGVFLKGAAKFTGTIANNARMRIGSKEITIALSTFPVDDVLTALLIKEIKKEEYISDFYKDQQMNAIKSAYLFIMNVNLITDKCENMNMSEISVYPVNERDISYTEWRKIIVNMFLPEDHERFNRISNPEYLKKHLHYHCSKSLDCQMMNLEGNYIWVKLIFSRINTGNDEDFRFLFMVEDIHESQIRLLDDLKKYENLANNDSLTCLFNHGKIESEISLCIDRCHAENKPVSLIMFDIDDFKYVNDTYGHAKGDYVLKTLSSIAGNYIASYGGKLGRWGGEEFVGICENTNEERIAEIAEELRIMISRYRFETVGNITSSFGVIQVDEDESPASAFDRIDAALYRAKSGGKNRVVRG